MPGMDNTTPADVVPDEVRRTIAASHDYLSGVGIPSSSFSRESLATAVVLLAELAGVDEPPRWGAA